MSRSTSQAPNQPSEPAESSAAGTRDAAVEHAARVAEFSLFYTTQMPSLVAHLSYLGVPVRLAADLAQDAMAEAFRQWDNLDHPRAWVRTVAGRMWHRRRADLAREVLHADTPAAPALLTDAQAEAIVQRHSVLAALNSLPLAEREVIAWTVDGYQPTEIAGILGKTPPTIRSLLRRARQHLHSAQTAEKAP